MNDGAIKTNVRANQLARELDLESRGLPAFRREQGFGNAPKPLALLLAKLVDCVRRGTDRICPERTMTESRNAPASHAGFLTPLSRSWLALRAVLATVLWTSTASMARASMIGTFSAEIQDDVGGTGTDLRTTSFPSGGRDLFPIGPLSGGGEAQAATDYDFADGRLLVQIGQTQWGFDSGTTSSTFVQFTPNVDLSFRGYWTYGSSDRQRTWFGFSLWDSSVGTVFRYSGNGDGVVGKLFAGRQYDLVCTLRHRGTSRRSAVPRSRPPNSVSRRFPSLALSPPGRFCWDSWQWHAGGSCDETMP